MVPCGSNAACQQGDTCYTYSSGGECSSQCECDPTGHYICPLACTAAGPGYYKCDQGVACNVNSPQTKACESSNAFCTFSCTCEGADESGKGAFACTETCKPDGQPSEGEPCGPGVACEPFSGCGYGLDDGCTVSCSCDEGTLSCATGCGGP